MLSFKRVVVLCVLAAFAPELFAALSWAAGVVSDVGSQPFVRGLGRSGLGLLLESGLIWGALWLLSRLAGRARGRGRGEAAAGEPSPFEDPYPEDLNGAGGGEGVGT